jgi:hypothetical protein
MYSIGSDFVEQETYSIARISKKIVTVTVWRKDVRSNLFVRVEVVACDTYIVL